MTLVLSRQNTFANGLSDLKWDFDDMHCSSNAALVLFMKDVFPLQFCKIFLKNDECTNFSAILKIFSKIQVFQL